MPRLSAGLLIYRFRQATLEVLLVHPGGPFWAKKDLTSWSIPKGEYDPLEDPMHAAKREFKEETGHEAPINSWVELSEVKYGNKIVKAWAVEADFDTAGLKSNLFSMEWPPRSGQQLEFPEVDRADWFDLATAKQKLVRGQVEFIDRLAEKLGQELPSEPTQPSLF